MSNTHCQNIYYCGVSNSRSNRLRNSIINDNVKISYITDKVYDNKDNTPSLIEDDDKLITLLNGEQAKNLGLVTHVDQNPLERALALAKEIASKSPDAVRAGKKLLEESWNAEERFGLELEDRLQRQLIGSPNQVEAITANFENREPNFTDPE